MEWSHTHFDGYELLAVPSESPASIVLLDSSALVLVQRVLLPQGDAPPRALTWQPGGASTGCSSGALACIVSTRGRGPELAVFTPNGVYLSSRVRYSWSCAARVPLSPLHKGACDRILLSWSCRGPLVVADQAISVWSNNAAVPSANANTFSSDDSGSSSGSSDDDSSGGEAPAAKGASSSSAFGPRSVYRNSLRLSRKWVRKGGGGGGRGGGGGGKTSRGTPARQSRHPNFIALATSPCGCMFAAACEGSEDVTVWLRRRNVPAQGKPWDVYRGSDGSGDGPSEGVVVAGNGAGGDERGTGAWNFQPATVLNNDGPLVQVVWGRGPGAQQDYLLTLGADGSAHVWVEQQWEDRFSVPTESGTVKFMKTATIKAWYGDPLRLKSVGFVKWAYFGSHSRDLVRDGGAASGSAYHLLHQQEQAAEGGARPYRSDNWIVGCGDDGRRFLWSLKDMPLPDGRTIPEPVEVASLPFSWLVGVSGGGAPAAAAAAAAAASKSSSVAPLISAVGYYDAQGADGAPTEVQVVAGAAGGTVAVMTARVHRVKARNRYVFRNTRSVVLPLGQAAGSAQSPGRPHTGNGRANRSAAGAPSKMRSKAGLEGFPHPNLPLLARVERGEGDAGGEGGRAVEVHSWVNGGSHLQCIPCKPRGPGRGQLGHTAGAEPEHADEAGATDVLLSGSESMLDDSSDGTTAGKDRVAPVFGELAQKVRSGDELSFIPYALPSLTLECRSRHERVVDGDDGPSVDAAVCYCGAGAACAGQGRGRIRHAAWMADWVGTEALPPALAVVDSNSRLHVFELDDGASSSSSSSRETLYDAEADAGAAGVDVGGALPAESGDRFNTNGLLGLGKRTPTKSSTGSLASLSNTSGHLVMKDFPEQDGRLDGHPSTPERTSRRARAEFGGPAFRGDRPPVEKTVVLPLDSKYGLGLTLAFQGNKVEVSTFVKHPDTSEMLPAEASGRIRPGDQLVDINGHSVEGLNAEQATSLIRQARRESMEGGAVSLELTFREAAPAPGATPVRSGSRSGSPRPRTGWYSKKAKLRGSARGSAKGSTGAGWASTDADQHALRWNLVGGDVVPAFETCVLLPWLGKNGTAGGGEGAGLTEDEATASPASMSRWAEIGVYPPGDERRRREALLLGFQPAQASSQNGDGGGYVAALLVEATPGGVSIAEVCRAPLEAGQQPVSFNREKTPPGAPANGRATVEAVCVDGWVRRWCIARDLPSGDAGGAGFALRKADICEPFRESGAEEDDKGPARSRVGTPAALIAVASPTLLAVARANEPWPRRVLTPARSFREGEKTETPLETEAAAGAGAPQTRSVLEVWSCAKTPYPRCPFKKNGTVVLPGLRPGQVVEGMCWVSPEAGDERGAAVSGHCLCVSMGGIVTVLARERPRHGSVPSGPVAAPGGGRSRWSPVFRVANPSSLLTCRTAGLRDFCQGLMAKYQRNLALSLVRTRGIKRLPAAAAAVATETVAEESRETPAAIDAPDHSPPAPLPLLRDEIAGLRGTTQEGRRLEDWHPESLVALWCTSLMADSGPKQGPRWEKGRERTLAVLHWVSKETGPECGGVMAGTVVPLLAHGSGALDAPRTLEGDLGRLKACFAAYLNHRLEDEKVPEGGAEDGVPTGSGHGGFGAAPSGRRLPHASARHFGKSSVSHEATPASARHVADTAAAAGVPRRLLNLSGAELSALSALLDVALGHDVGGSAATPAPVARATGAGAGDTAAALFSKSSSSSSSPPAPPSASMLPGLRSGEDMPTAVIATTNDTDDYASVFLLARGLRARLVPGGGGRGGGTRGVDAGIASSAALAMLLAPNDTQTEVLEMLCPKSGGGVVAPGPGLTWGDASEMLLPLWVRDASELQRVTEAVASATFLQDRDLMAAAMFFAALGKEAKLLALAKADRGFVGQRKISGGEGDVNSASGRSQGATQGERLEKLLAHDFSTPRGRTVAEKNAYILLRKRKFKSAAAVFLLPRPAMLKEALQVILMHVKDLQLALVIARLVEIRDGGGASVPTRAVGSLGGMGGMGGYGGGVGGFGGRARGSFGAGFHGGVGGGSGGGFGEGDDEVEVTAAAVHKSLGGASRKLLRDELLPVFVGKSDVSHARNRLETAHRPRSTATTGSAQAAAPLQRNPFLECVALFWLGQSDRALRALCRGPATNHDSSNNAVPSTPGAKVASTVVTDKASGLLLCNHAIDVATRPFLVSKLQQRASGSGGGGKPGSSGAGRSATSLGGFVGGGSRSYAALTNGGRNGNGNSTSDPDNGDALVNAQRAAALRLTTVEYLARHGMEIPALEVLGTNAGAEWASDLAKRQRAEGAVADVPKWTALGTAVDDPGRDDFSGGVFSGLGRAASGARPKPQASASAASAAAAAAAAAAASGELSGDIFGAFDGPPRRPAARKPAISTASGELSGDMFGGFDAAPPARKVKQASAAATAAAAASGEISGDMFGGFDGPPRARPTPPPAPASSTASGELSGDIFGGFDAAPMLRKAKPASAAVNAAASASGELSGDMFGGFDAAPPQRKVKQAPAAASAAAAASGELSGDMFGGFDAAPPRRKASPPPVASPVASGELSGDMFGGFDLPQRSPTAQTAKALTATAKPRLTSPAAVATGELSSDLFSGFDGPPTALSSPGSGTRTPGSIAQSVSSPGGSSIGGGPTSPRASSYGYFEGEEPSWEEYDKDVAWRSGGEDAGDGVGGDANGMGSGEKGMGTSTKAPNSDAADVPQRWDVWAEDLAYEAATKRLLRELRHLFAGLDALAPTAPNMAFALESLGTTAADPPSPGVPKPALLEGIRAVAGGLCEAHGLSARALTAAAAGALSHASAGGSRRLGALCLLLNALDRPVAVDAAVCAAAGRLVQCCSAHGQAHLEDLGLRAAHARALGTQAEAAREEARAKAASEAGDTDGDAGGDDWGASRLTEGTKRPAGSFITAAVAAATAERKSAEARAAEAEAAEAAGGLGLENLRPHLSELRAAAFQLELCLALHARGCLRLSSRARAEAAVGFRAGLLVEALGRRYDVTAALVACPPASMEADGPRLSDAHATEEAFPEGGEEHGRDQGRAWLETPNAGLLDALSHLSRPEFETLGLEPWESSLRGRPTMPKEANGRFPDVTAEERSLRNIATSGTMPTAAAGDSKRGHVGLDDPVAERLHLARLTDSLSRGVWPTYARLACALNLLGLRAMHTQLCRSFASLVWREDCRARAPLAARVCGAVPFHPADEGGVALGTERKGGDFGGGGGGGGSGGGESNPPSSSTFYSAFLHPLYVWAQCLDRQFYSQAHRPRVSPAHHLLPRRRGRPASSNSLVPRDTGNAAPPALATSSQKAPRQQVMASTKARSPTASAAGRYESTLVPSPGAARRECCPYLFQRGMVVSEEGVRGGQDHLRSDEAWPEEDGEEQVAYQMLNGMRRADGSALASVPLHAVREGMGADTHFVEAFYASDARRWLMRSGVNPAGPSAGARVRKWETMGIVQRVSKAEGTGGHIHFRGDRHKGDTLLRFVDRWDVEHCGESAGAALRAGPLGRMSYQLVPAGSRSAASRETLYGKLLHAIGDEAASDLWTRLGAEDWLVRTVARAEFPFSYRHQLAELPSHGNCPDTSSAAGQASAVVRGPLTPAAAAAAAADLPCAIHDGNRPERDAFCLCVFEHLCRNALFRRLRLPHRFQALVTVQLLGLKNLSPHYHPSKTDVFAAVSLKRLEPACAAAAPTNGNGVGGNHGGGHHGGGHTGGETAAKRRGRNTSVTAIKRLLPTANGQASQQSRWGAKAAFRFPLPEEASPYLLAYGDGAYDLVMGGYDGESHGNGGGGGVGGAGKGMGSQGPPRCVRIAVWRKQFLADQRLGEVDVPLRKLNDREDLDEWVGLRGDKGSAWFVNVRFSLRFVMVSVSDPILDDDSEDMVEEDDENPGMTLSYALADVDIM